MRLLHQLPPNTYDDDLALTPRDGPAAVLALIAEVTESALSKNLYLLHPPDVDLSGGRAQVVPTSACPDRSVSTGPEVHAGGPVPSTLSYAVAAIAVLVTLGTLEIAPEEAEAHRTWVDRIRERLQSAWSGLPSADATIDILARCLAFSPADRPHPNNLVEEIVRVRALLARPPEAEPVAPPPPFLPKATPARIPSVSAPAAAVRISAPGAPPIVVPLSHPLVPYAMATVVLASLALAVALCTFGAVVGRFEELLDPPAPSSVLVPLPEAHPQDPSVAPASLFDRFERTPLVGEPVVAPPPEALAPPAIPAGSSAASSSSAIPAPAALPAQARTGSSGVGHGGGPSGGEAAPVPTKPMPTDRPRAAPGSDLLDPWSRR